VKQIRELAVTICIGAVISSCSLAVSAQSKPNPTVKKSTVRQAVKPAMKDETASQLLELKETMERQQAAMSQMQRQLQQTQDELQKTQGQLNQLQGTAQQADIKAAAAVSENDLQVEKVQAAVSDLKAGFNTATATVAKEEQRVASLENPGSIAYKGVRFTPGGFIEMTEYFRSHATLSDIATPFQSIPLESQVTNGYNTHLTELGMSARGSRITIRADAPAGKTKLTAYYEMDFLGTGPTSNPNQTTSYVPRVRQVWGRAKFSNGWTFTGGQMWNLITLNRKGTDADNSNLWIPSIIEAQYSIGYDWGRFAEARVSKTLSDKVALAVELANPSYLNSGANSAVSGLAANGAGLDGNSLVSSCTLSTATPPVLTCTNTPTYSTNLAPDMIVKLAYDSPRLGHYEVKGLGRLFRDRVVSTATVPGWNNTALGGGIAGGAVIPLAPKKLDFILQGMYGKGVSRYQDAGQYDFVVRATDHNMQTIQSLSALAGLESHPTKRTELDAIFGDEYYARSTYRNGTTVAGYGAPSAINTGCYYETVPTGVNATCTGNNRDLWNGKLYGYYDVYKGPMGTLRYGAEIDYIERGTWSGAGGLAPKGNDTAVYSTMRYMFP